MQNFFILAEIGTPQNPSAKTYHYSDRNDRNDKISKIIGDGQFITSFVVDKCHRNGNEIHSIYDNGVIVITNARTGRLITQLIARPPQLFRYWDGLNQPFPTHLFYLIEKAREHQRKGYNNW